MAFSVFFSPTAEIQLLDIEAFIAENTDLKTAKTFTDALVRHCLDLETLPHRGKPRDNLRPGLRTISFRGRVTVAYAVAEREVTILAILYAGRDVDTVLRDLGG